MNMSSSDSVILTSKQIFFKTVGRSSRVWKTQDQHVHQQMMLKSYILLNKKGQSSCSVSEAKCHNCSLKQDGHVWKGCGPPCSPNCASGVPGRALTVMSQKSAEKQLIGAVRPVLRRLSSPAANHIFINVLQCVGIWICLGDTSCSLTIQT